MALDPAVTALIGSAAGAVILKVVEHFLSKGQVKTGEAQRIREELRMQIEQQREDISALETEVDEWRSRYYDLRDDHVKLQAELIVRIKELKEEMTNDNSS